MFDITFFEEGIPLFAAVFVAVVVQGVSHYIAKIGFCFVKYFEF